MVGVCVCVLVFWVSTLLFNPTLLVVDLIVFESILPYHFCKQVKLMLGVAMGLGWDVLRE